MRQIEKFVHTVEQEYIIGIMTVLPIVGQAHSGYITEMDNDGWFKRSPRKSDAKNFSMKDAEQFTILHNQNKGNCTFYAEPYTPKS